jgi:hypothetical protein
MNYPLFSFDYWLNRYYITSLFFHIEEPDIEQVETELDIFHTMKDCFYQQLHIESDEVSCQCCNFLKILQKFNKFCAIVSQKDWKTDEIVSHFIENSFPLHKRPKHIAKALCGGIKSYNSVDEHGYTFEFKKYMVKNIEKLLAELQIK